MDIDALGVPTGGYRTGSEEEQLFGHASNITRTDARCVMLPDMRTTIDLDEDAIEAAKQLAKERGRTPGRAALPSTGSFAEKLSLTRLSSELPIRCDEQ